MRRLLWWLVALAVLGVVAVVAIFRVPALQDFVIARVIDRMVGQTSDELFAEDALRVALCGSSAPLPFT